MPSLTTEDYHVGIICALDSEMAAVEAMLDQEHEINIAQDTHDHNAYSVGRIHAHNVVIACLPAGVDGLAAAATRARDMSRTFSQLRFGLLVGIGGGIPDLERGIDIRLGDIVVSEPTGTTGGVVQYDKGKLKAEGEWERKGTLNAPPTSLLTALQKLKARHLRYDSAVPSLMADMLQRYPKMARSGYAFPGQDKDCFRRNIQNDANGYAVSSDLFSYEIVPRSPRTMDDPEIHYGIIASGNHVIKDAAVRDRLGRGYDALCVEMEAAGLMNEFPCLVIRGICDYADAHKNDQWHRYAASTAAAYAKELLSYVSAEQTEHEKPVQQILSTLNEHFQQIHKHNDRHDAHLQQQETHYQTDKQRDCHRAFKTSSYEEHKNRNPERAPNTCRWLLNHERYLKWQKNSQTDLLWVSADPGCGKSVLSRSLIDTDLTSGGNDPKTIVCYFFFKDNGVQDGLDTALCAVLHQLFDHQPQLIRFALPVWEKNGSKIASEVDELWRILLTAMADQNTIRTVCVLDALDECRAADRVRLVSMLCQFYNNTDRATSVEGRLKFLVTSRPYHDLEYCFGGIATSLPSIRLRGEDENDQIHEEIDSVVRQLVYEIAREFRLSSTATERLKEKLLTMEHRTYLWLHLAASSIRNTFSNSPRPDQESIELLPASVDEAYEQILSRSGDKKTVRAILLIIAGARRPLTVGEMALALSIATSKTTPQSLSDLDVREDQLISRIRHWCGLFIFINHSRLYLIHQTAKEFLLRDFQQTWVDSGKWQHSISTTDITHEMARLYVLYLSLEEFDGQELEMKFVNLAKAPHWVREIPSFSHVEEDAGHKVLLFELASESWAGHWRDIESVAEESLKEKVWMLYDMQSCRFARWIKFMWSSSDDPSDLPKTDIEIAAHNGHVGIIHRILDLGSQNITAKGETHIYSITQRADACSSDPPTRQSMVATDVCIQGRYCECGIALQLASKNGYEEVVQMLLDAGADVDAQGGSYGSALQAASNGGYNKIVQMLLDAGADVNAQGGGCGNALYIGSSRRHDKVVQMLLDAGADVNARGDYFPSALVAASTTGHEKMVQMLLDAGADVNAQDREKRSALYIASKGGHKKVVQMLLDAGADVNAQDRENGSALYIASKGGHKKVVQMLLDAGADVNTQERYYGSALGIASKEGHYDMVQMLLDAGADVNAQGGQHSNALQAASNGGHDKVVQILLDAGADVDAQGRNYGSALYAASKGGHDNVVQMLLDGGADVNTQAAYYGSALCIASEAGHHKIVQMLIDAGADVNARRLDGSALHIALEKGDDTVVQILLDAGADVNAQGDFFDIPLHTASRKGHDKMVQMLLDAGADVHARRWHDISALLIASEGGHDKIVHILLDAGAGADINVQEGLYSSPLQAASGGGHNKVIQMLLDAGADVNAQRPRWGSALYIASEGGHNEVVQMLLDAGADVNAQGGQHSNALQAASSKGHDKVVQILLDAGADVNAQKGPYDDGLEPASRKFRERLVQKQLDDEAGVHAQVRFYDNALQVALSGGHEKVVQMLLDAGADVNAQGGECGTALQAASDRGHDEAVQTLLDAGADANAQGGVWGSALQAASGRGHCKVVQMLLDAGADINIQGGRHGNALQAALHNEHAHVARLLCKHNALDVHDFAGDFFHGLEEREI